MLSHTKKFVPFVALLKFFDIFRTMFAIACLLCFMQFTSSSPIIQPIWQQNSSTETMNVNKSALFSFWTPERMAEALASEHVLSLSPFRLNESYYKQTSSSRTKRSVSDFWTQDKINSASDPMPSVPLDALGMSSTERIQLMAHVEMAEMELADMTTAPFSAYGRLFAEMPNGKLTSCTAAHVGPTQRILLTAAHCIHDGRGGDGWYKNNVMFVQHYEDTIDSGYKKEVKWLFVGGLGYRENYGLDYAFLVVDEPNQFAGLGIDYADFPWTITAAGYPDNAYDNERLVYVESKCDAHENFLHSPSNPLGKGSSGGAWTWEKSDGWYAVGVNSFSYIGDSPPGMFSPRFNSETKSLYLNAEAKVQELSSNSDEDE